MKTEKELIAKWMKRIVFLIKNKRFLRREVYSWIQTLRIKIVYGELLSWEEVKQLYLTFHKIEWRIG